MKNILSILVTVLILTLLLLSLKPVSAAYATTITWSGINWKISNWAGSSDAMPGFVFDPCNVTKDSSGRLVLTLVKVGNVWKGAEISTPYTRSFGTYYVQVYSSLGTLPPSAVFGFFIYKGWQYDGTNEIDIEYSQWGNSSANNWNYTVYPASSSGVKSSKTFGFSTAWSTTHSFVWSQKSVYFQSSTGLKTPPFGTPFTSWKYAPINYLRDIPQTPIPLLINLWAHKTAKMGSATKYVVVLSKVVTP
jgi:hypothetical protein